MKRKTSTLLIAILAMLMSAVNAQNRSSILQFPDFREPVREVGSSVSFVTESYAPGTTLNLVFYYNYATPDGEWDDGVSLDFPEGVYVNSASVCTVTGYHQIAYNGETGDGALVTWGDMNGGSGLGGLHSSGEFWVNVSISEDFSGPMQVVWYVAGDGWGAPPNFATGEIELPQALDFDLAVVSFQPVFVILGGEFVPRVKVRNVGCEIMPTFTVNVDVPEFEYNHTIVISEPIAPNEIVEVEFPAYTTSSSGVYTATATITEGGGEVVENDVLVVNGLVSPLADAYAINGVTLSYDEVRLSTGEMISVGSASSYPWQMAEEFDGNFIYRIHHDYSIGIVNPDGSFVQLGLMTGGVQGNPTGLAYNWDTGLMYMVALSESTDFSHLYIVDMETFELTEIGVYQPAIIGMDFANDGYLYGVSLQDELIKFDVTTAQFTVVGALGVDIVYPQDVSYDVETGKLYTIASGFYFSHFGTYDLTTGAFETIADLQGYYYYTLVITKVPAANPATLEFVINDADGLAITDAVVAVNETANQAGDYIFELEPGTYSYTVTKEGYFPLMGEVVMGSENQTITLVMEIDDTSIDIENHDRISIFPNPASNYIMVNAPFELSSIRILAIDGREVLHVKATSGNNHIQINGLEAGMYIMQMNTNSAVFSRKIQIIK